MRNAYMIMAHNRFDVLRLLLEDLDVEDNDIFLHVDKKSKSFDEAEMRTHVKRARLFCTKRISVHWGDSSQVDCELLLLKAATNEGFHDYYHLLAGVSFPIKSQEYIQRFLEANRGKEFIGFAHDNNFAFRIRYYYFFTKMYRSKALRKVCGAIGCALLAIEKKIGVNRLAHPVDWYQKGNTTFSITDACARYVVSKEKEIRKMCRHTYCADELFLQTTVYHSEFYNNVYDVNDEFRSAMRLTTWENPRHWLERQYMSEILHSEALFARKFDYEGSEYVIETIRKMRK